MEETVQWLSVKDIVKAFGFKTKNSVYYHINHGFKDIKLNDVDGTVLVNKEAFGKWHKEHNMQENFYKNTPKGNKEVNLKKLKGPLHEKMSEYTREELNSIKKQRCRFCYYSMVMDVNRATTNNYADGICCYYQVLTHKERPTRAELCQLYLSDGSDILPVSKSSESDLDRRKKIIDGIRRKEGLC